MYFEQYQGITICTLNKLWGKNIYSRTSMAKTLMARLPWLFRTHA